MNLNNQRRNPIQRPRLPFGALPFQTRPVTPLSPRVVRSSRPEWVSNIGPARPLPTPPPPETRIVPWRENTERTVRWDDVPIGLPILRGVLRRHAYDAYNEWEQRAAAVGLIDTNHVHGTVMVVGNDYEELLRLDNTVARRGVSSERMKSIKIVNRKVPALDHSSCVICMEALVGKMYVLSCSHRFHVKCLGEWFKSNTTCPMCRAEVS